MHKLILIGLMFLQMAFAQDASNQIVMVEGDSFRIPDTQEIEFVPLKKFDYAGLPKKLNLRKFQSQIKSQGQRGSCTYFVFTSLVESLMKKQMTKEVDLSEEYLAWSGKVQKKLRILDEGSSVAVNAATFQEYGYMLEADMPYQPSWFDKGYPCEGQRDAVNIDPICFSHAGPKSDQPIYKDERFVFEAVDSSSLDLVRALDRYRSPVTVSLIGHSEMWDQSKMTGDFFLSEKHKKECQENRKLCGGHAVLAIGYDLDKRIVYIKNSWGEEWGQKGFGTISFDYLDQMSDRKLLTGFIRKLK